jgi:DNA-binding HxlR family transcriptional regulator
MKASNKTSRPRYLVGKKRSYEDGCAVAHALELVGDRWALLVVRELLLGPKRFTDLRAGLPGISANVLTQRLDELVRAGVARSRKLPAPAFVAVYELTEWGHGLEPVLMAVGRWAARSPHLPIGRPFSVSSSVLSLRAMFSPALARGFDARVALRISGLPFRAVVASGKLELEPGDLDAPEATLETDPDTLVAVIYGGRSLSEAKRSGSLQLAGKPEVLKRFVTLFPLPNPAPEP